MVEVPEEQLKSQNRHSPEEPFCHANGERAAVAGLHQHPRGNALCAAQQSGLNLGFQTSKRRQLQAVLLSTTAVSALPTTQEDSCSSAKLQHHSSSRQVTTARA